MVKILEHNLRTHYDLLSLRVKRSNLRPLGLRQNWFVTPSSGGIITAGTAALRHKRG
ncbi:hypothetical protein [Kamptonema sp. UHCC 0994]|uniref:hypothetical protein n=1 Tax=Kamptonema sp. UHCC 0994 TaxID=3031329 RepID=UPI0023B8FBEF|nr:hypothetical protein [Kamptonema sp. UHCC 0994]MDF0555021.1 hypothetical protein [Kamptonema sp. UHCC 0994]